MTDDDDWRWSSIILRLKSELILWCLWFCDDDDDGGVGCGGQWWNTDKLHEDYRLRNLIHLVSLSLFPCRSHHISQLLLLLLLLLFLLSEIFFRLLCPDDTRSIRGPQISSMNVYRTLERTPVIYEKRWNSLSSFLVQIRKWNPNDDIIDSQVINSYWLLMIKIILMILHRSVQWKTDRKNLIRSKLTALFQNDFSINFKIYETLRDFEKKVGFYDFFSSNLCQLWWSSYSDLLVFFWIKRS